MMVYHRSFCCWATLRCNLLRQLRIRIAPIQEYTKVDAPDHKPSIDEPTRVNPTRLHPHRGMMAMFKHLLLPTDGSQSSDAAIQAGVRFAKSINAKVTGFYAMPKFHMLTYQTEMLTDTKQEFAKDCKAHADRFLAVVAQAAKAAGVPCETELQTSDHPYEAIIATAKEKGCDLIVMASHGRSGVQAFLLGSETQKVLTHSGIPVLVFR
jgi:nucleotide-binding universal stress UspA family protein